MKKSLLVGLMLVAGVAMADNELSYTPNKAGGYMIFTYTDCVWVATQQRVPNQYYVYSTNGSGVKIADGCYEYKYPFYFIGWNKGGNTTININTVTSLVKP